MVQSGGEPSVAFAFVVQSLYIMGAFLVVAGPPLRFLACRYAGGARRQTPHSAKCGPSDSDACLS
jgi:hypothetical protein